jgi:hypothetical protein
MSDDLVHLDLAEDEARLVRETPFRRMVTLHWLNPLSGEYLYLIAIINRLCRLLGEPTLPLGTYGQRLEETP